MDFRGAYKHTPKLVNGTLITMFILGWVGLVVGLVLDRNDAWGDLAFTPNIYTSLVSF